MSKPRDELVTQAIRSLFAASALLDPLRLQIWDEEGLTVTQLRLLRFVSEDEGLSNADLADRLYVTRPSVSALLERLERGGFIRREMSPVDRRGICIWLEEKGRQALANLRAESSDYVAGLMVDLSEGELRTLSEALSSFVRSGRERRKQDLEALRQS